MADLRDPDVLAFLAHGTRAGKIGWTAQDGRRTATELGARHVGADRAEGFGVRSGVPGELVVRLRPSKVIATLDVTAS